MGIRKEGSDFRGKRRRGYKGDVSRMKSRSNSGIQEPDLSRMKSDLCQKLHNYNTDYENAIHTLVRAGFSYESFFSYFTDINGEYFTKVFSSLGYNIGKEIPGMGTDVDHNEQKNTVFDSTKEYCKAPQETSVEASSETTTAPISNSTAISMEKNISGIQDFDMISTTNERISKNKQNHTLSQKDTNNSGSMGNHIITKIRNSIEQARIDKIVNDRTTFLMNLTI